MKTVLLRGPVLTKSGYGVHTRQIFSYLKTKNVEVAVQPLHWGMTPWYLNRSSCEGLIGDIVGSSSFDPNKKYDVTIQVQLPNEWDASLGKYNIGVTAGVETDFANPNWTNLHVNKMDKVIVPSEFTKKSLTKKGNAITDIEVIPEAYFSELSKKPKKDPYSRLLKTDFNFLTVGVLTGNRPATDRKNLFYLIKWFKEAFEGNEDVGLIIKTNSGRDTEIDKKMTRGLLQSVLQELNHEGAPSIYLLHGGMTRSEMNELYKSKKVKAYLSATRGEGFGLPLLEAAVTGLPVIATDWSAHTEFLNKGKWVKIENTLKPVSQEKLDKNIFLEGMRWAEIDEGDFKRKIQKFYDNNSLPRKWAEKLSKILREEYSQEKINELYDNVLKEILD